MSSNEGHRLAIRDLSVLYPDRTDRALDRVDETIEEGEIVAVTGPSGCGKSTLCRMIAGFVPSLVPAEVSGEVRIADRLVDRMSPEAIAGRVGFVQQDPDAQICTLRVRQEVAFGPENLCLPADEIRSRVEASLAAMRIEALAERSTPTLSGGEKQRLAVASILAMHPRVLLLDEPSASLDPEGARDLFSLLKGLSRDERRTLVVVEHRLRPLLGLRPRLVVLDRGRIVARRDGREPIDLVAAGLRDAWPAARPVRRPGPAALALERIAFGYDRPLFSGLSLTVRGGEILGVIGPNGGGKTSLLRLIAGLERPWTGTIRRPESARVGFVFQHPHHQIFERTVARELRIDGQASDREVAARLATARLDGLAAAPPLSLSLGEQRRLTLMTALARDPDLVLLDEPFIGQDRRNVVWILSRLLRVRHRGGIVVLVSHDIDLIGALSDRVLFLGGEAIAGRPGEVFAQLAASGRPLFTPLLNGGGS